MATFDTYSGNFESSLEEVSLKQTFLNSAMEMVSSYIGYSIEEKIYEDELIESAGSRVLFFPASPIKEITYLSIGGLTFDTNILKFKGDKVHIKGYGYFPKGFAVATFKAGWTEENLPSTIKETILRIATLMLAETNGNIGVTSKTFGDNTRSFVQYTNYAKYLEPLQMYKLYKVV